MTKNVLKSLSTEAESGMKNKLYRTKFVRYFNSSYFFWWLISLSLDLIGQDKSNFKLYSRSPMGLEFSAFGNESRFSKLIKT